MALLEASSGKIGSVVDRFVLFCYHYDPKTRSYSMVDQSGDDRRVVSGTVLFFGGYLAVFWRREKKKKRKD